MSQPLRDLANERFTDYAASHEMTREDVLEQVDESFGEPLLVVAAGSVIAGFGNATSDLDLYVVVPNDVASSLPLMSYPGGARIEVLLHPADSLLTRHGEVTAAAWPPPEIAPGDLIARRQVLDSLSRFGLGLRLGGTEEWTGWQEGLAGELTGWLCAWHAVEAVRKRIAVRALVEAKPMVAAVRAGEALIAALERHAALHGEPYFKWKWLGEKLRRIGDEAGLRAFEHAACPPLTPAQVPGYLERAEELLDTYLAGVDTTSWRAHVRLGVGTDRHPFGQSLLVSRWRMRAVSLPSSSPVAAGASWDYGLDDPWDEDVAALFIEDMAWLGVRGVG